MFVVPDTERIRDALAQRVPCKQCGGDGHRRCEDRCPECDGAGTIPNTVPGAKLLERGEHLRVL
jgi:DnaJ-class molecular chaperone